MANVSYRENVGYSPGTLHQQFRQGIDEANNISGLLGLDDHDTELVRRIMLSHYVGRVVQDHIEQFVFRDVPLRLSSYLEKQETV